MSDQSNDWQMWSVLWPTKTITGERAQGPVMRRRTAEGRWEYRKMTASEEEEYVSKEAW